MRARIPPGTVADASICIALVQQGRSRGGRAVREDACRAGRQSSRARAPMLQSTEGADDSDGPPAARGVAPAYLSTTCLRAAGPLEIRARTRSRRWHRVAADCTRRAGARASNGAARLRRWQSAPTECVASFLSEDWLLGHG